MLNRIFVALIFASVLLGAATGKMAAVTDAILKDGAKAVTLAIGLIGVMALFLGLMRVAEKGGILQLLARWLAPILRRLFPDVPPDHPAMQAMILNIASNMLGLANAATPFGIKAIEELDTLNSRKGTATNAMVLFLAINTSGLAILPSGVIALRASLGSTNASGIFLTTWVASACATIVGITAALLLCRLPGYRATQPPPLTAEHSHSTAAPAGETPQRVELEPVRRWRVWAVVIFFLAFAGLLIQRITVALGEIALWEVLTEVASVWILPAIVSALVLFGWARGVRVYDAVVEGAREGWEVAKRIIPYLVTILVSVGMFRASGGIDLLGRWLGPLTEWIGMPAEALPMAILRPLSGSGAYGVMAEIMKVHGPDSLIGYMVSTIQGSTETTFYVLAVYFGAVGIKRTRHALPACLLADLAGILSAVFIVNLLFG